MRHIWCFVDLEWVYFVEWVHYMPWFYYVSKVKLNCDFYVDFIIFEFGKWKCFDTLKEIHHELSMPVTMVACILIQICE